MNEKIWQDTYRINWHETDFKGFATPVTMCNFLGESAGRQANSLGFGYEDAVRLNQFWVVLRWAIKMDAYPRWKDEIIMETWPRMPEHISAFRDYTIKTTDGKMLGAATSTWMVLDAKSHRPQKLELVEGALDQTIDKKSLDENARKIQPPQECDALSKIESKYSDMDLHGHVINSRYVQWCLDLFDKNFHKNHMLAELQINFLHECRFGDQLELKVQKLAEMTFVIGAANIVTGKNVFTAELIWEKNKPQ